MFGMTSAVSSLVNSFQTNDNYPFFSLRFLCGKILEAIWFKALYSPGCVGLLENFPPTELVHSFFSDEDEAVLVEVFIRLFREPFFA